jgi:hypothetical protein
MSQSPHCNTVDRDQRPGPWGNPGLGFSRRRTDRLRRGCHKTQRVWWWRITWKCGWWVFRVCGHLHPCGVILRLSERNEENTVWTRLEDTEGNHTRVVTLGSVFCLTVPHYWRFHQKRSQWHVHDSYSDQWNEPCWIHYHCLGGDCVQQHIWDSLVICSHSGVTPEAPVYLSQNCQSSRVLTCGLHRSPKSCGHSIRNQGNYGVPPVEYKSIYRNLFVNPEMETWVERQKPQTQDKFRTVKFVVLSDTNFW